MKKREAPSSRRAEIQRLYQRYASEQTTMPACAFLRFLHKKQMELTANEETVETLIDRYEIEETAKESRSMTFEGFFRYMESKDCCVFNQAHASVYQDMDQPLTSYFISSSHNTYLTGDQIVGKSHLDAYVCALRKGCRCLEIDCWDGPNMEPVVYHGYTLTTKIFFKDVITTVKQHAFEVSAYPVILSLENHCSLEQQEVMAQYLISILGEKLLRTPLDHPFTGEIPSPNDLKYKILIKNKKLEPKIKAEDASGTEAAAAAEDASGTEAAAAAAAAVAAAAAAAAAAADDASGTEAAAVAAAKDASGTESAAEDASGTEAAAASEDTSGTESAAEDASGTESAAEDTSGTESAAAAEDTSGTESVAEDTSGTESAAEDASGTEAAAEDASGTAAAAEESVDKGENDDDDEEDEEDKDLQTKAKFWSPRKAGNKKKKKKVVVAEALSDLVIYTRSVKFISFSHSKDNQNYYENTSMAERKARKLAKTSGADFVWYNQKFLSRIYPAGLRTSSSNYNPQEFWNVGSQLVALNFQSLGLPMDLNDGRFQDNGGCGYILKPAVLMSSQTSFDPGCSQKKLKPTRMMLKVISGSNLPVSRNGKALDPFVRVEIHGIPSDSCKKSTLAIKNNSLSPHWNTEMNFTISVPELCLIRFCVRDQTSPLISEFVGQYTLPFTSLKKGYRWVPLLSRDGRSLDPASLFVFVEYS